MPAAELVVPWALAQAVSARQPIAAVVAIGDCAPAAGALNAASSSVPQMAELVRAARELVPQWLGVAVPREHNMDPDRLSHPSLAEAVCEDARGAGLTVVRLDVPEACWQRLEATLALDAGDWQIEADGQWVLA